MTDRKLTEDAGRSALDDLRIVMDRIPVPITRCSRDLRYVWVNTACAELLGRPVDEIVGAPIVDILGSDAFQQLKPNFERVLSGQVVSYEAQVPYRGIGPRWVRVTYTPTRDRHAICDGWVAVVIDIDERKRMEERVDVDLAAMTKLQEIGTACASTDADVPQCLLQILDVAIAVTKAAKGTLQVFDDETGALQLVAQRGFEEPFVQFFGTVQTDDAASCGAAMRSNARVVVEDVTHSEIFAGQPSRGVLLDAGVRAVQSTPLVSSRGTLIGMISTHHVTPRRADEQELRWVDLLARTAADFLERSRTERQLLQANAMLREMNERKDEFLAMLGHEFRNPLGALSTAVSVLDAPECAADASERARGVLRRQTQHLTRILDDLLDVARLVTGKITLQRAPMDLGQLVDRCVTAMADTSAHRITRALESVLVDGDPTRLEQVAANLLSNALKYTPPGGEIRIAVRADGPHAVLEVEDTGVGIAPELLGRVFDLFVQGDRTSDQPDGGIGLGLALVRQFVTLHGGTVDAHSEGVNRGSRFVVRLPRIEAPSPTSEAPATPHQARRRRILLIEDNADARAMLRSYLQIHGHEVHEAADGLRGLEEALRLQPDVVLIDIGLPGLDGYEVARQLRSKLGGVMRLIAATGYGRAEDRERAMAAGFDTHLTKPVEPEALLRLLG